MFKLEQDKIDGTTFYCGVCIGDRHYIVNYSSVDKNDCGADRLFQFATVHPFNDLDLAEMIRLVELNMPVL
ncbi:hypothetical protein [Yersinia sp. 2541 StPb PI]|uniref:hypothetical protein n=1 Tax=Yersinia sp. 2541 StPb PI TaxID=3117407 RepID=UPI003FA49B24